MSARVVATERGPVEAATTGSGPAVLLVHGMPGTWEQTVSLADDLQRDHTVVLVSRPGYGATPLGSGRTAAQQADLYAALLDALRIDDVTVAGISGGGPSALAFAQRHPTRTRGLALLCAVAVGAIDVPTVARMLTRAPTAMWQLGARREQRRNRRLLADPAKLEAHLTAGLTPTERDRLVSDPRVRTDLVALMTSQTHCPPWGAGMRNDFSQIARPTAAPMDAITAATVVVHGDHDTVVPLASAELHASAIAGARLEIVEDAGHVFPVTNRATTLDHLRSLP